MEIALIHDNQLILGPVGFNVRMINSELRDFEIEDFVTSQSYQDLPIHFDDGLTHLLPLEKVIPDIDPKYQKIGNFQWEIVKENNIPTKVVLTYPSIDKTLEEVKELRNQEVSPARKEKENTVITITLYDEESPTTGTEIEVSTSREERVLLASKLSATPGPHNFKFRNTWKQISADQLKYIISEIDTAVQGAFDWELSKLQEIDACQTIDEVYDVVVREDSPLDPEVQ